MLHSWREYRFYEKVQEYVESIAERNHIENLPPLNLNEVTAILAQKKHQQSQYQNNHDTQNINSSASLMNDPLFRLGVDTQILQEIRDNNPTAPLSRLQQKRIDNLVR